jgi:hypothetical protein
MRAEREGVYKNLGNIDAQIDSINGDIGGLYDRVIKIETKVDLIYLQMNPGKTFAPGSPLTLTPKGREIARDIQAESLFAKYRERLIALIDRESLGNAYDIQSAAMNCSRDDLPKMMDAGDLNTIKNAAFTHGLLLDDITGILGICLRDEILIRRGISVSEVDKCRAQPA